MSMIRERRAARAVVAAIAVAGWLQPAMGAAQQDPRLRRPIPTITCACPVEPAKLPRIDLSLESPEGQAVLALASRICAEATRLPKNASADDLEAAIVYAISQSGLSDQQALAALQLLMGCDYGQRNLAAAIARVRASLMRGGLKRGTAALGNAGGFGNSSFVAPSVNVGGGSSNYTR